MSNRLVAALDALATDLLLSRDSTLFRSGEAASAVYIVRQGTIALTWGDAPSSVPMETLGPGSIVGLPAALTGSYCATALAMENTELRVIDARRAAELLKSDPSLGLMAVTLLDQEVVRLRKAIATSHTPGAWPKQDDGPLA